MITLTASDLTRWQTCRRRWLLERVWKVARWRPKALFDSCLRAGVLSLSDGCAPATVVANARTRFLAQAANPGLEPSGGDPWTVAQDWCGMLGVVLTAISRSGIPAISKITSTIQLPAPSTGVSYLPLSASSVTRLHRWITLESWTDAALAREAHSWHVIADIAMTELPLDLHVIEIGRQVAGRRNSPWARCWKHPVIAGMFRFQRPDGKGGWRRLSGDKWAPLWYADQTKPDPEQWCDLMDDDHVTPALLHHQSISLPSLEQCRKIRGEIAQLASEMKAEIEMDTPPMTVPMARTACDPLAGGPCSWQALCFGAPTADPVTLGLYQIRAAPASESSSIPVSRKVYAGASAT